MRPGDWLRPVLALTPQLWGDTRRHPEGAGAAAMGTTAADEGSRLLRRRGHRHNSVDFPSHHLSGAANRATPSQVDVIGNEIDYDQPGTDRAEFLELKNVDSRPSTSAVLGRARERQRRRAVYLIIDASAISRRRRLLVICANAADDGELRSRRLARPQATRTARPTRSRSARAARSLGTVSYAGNTGAPYDRRLRARARRLDSAAGVGISPLQRDGVDTTVTTSTSACGRSRPDPPNAWPPTPPFSFQTIRLRVR